MIAVVAKIPIQEGKMDEAIAIFKELIPNLKNDPGTEMYNICVDKNDPNTIVVVEAYADADALKLHGSTDHFKATNKKLGGVVGGRPEISRMEVLASL